MDEKAQGALEYLLLIGGAVLIAAIVIVLISGMSGASSGSVKDANSAISGGLSDINSTLNTLQN